MEKWKTGLDSFQFGRKFDVGLSTIGTPILIKEALSKKDLAVVEAYDEGTIKEGSSKEILEKLTALGGKLLHKRIGDQSSSYIWVWENAMVELDFSGKTYCTLGAISHNEELILNLRKMIKSFFCAPVKKGHVYAIVASGGRLALNNIGNAGIPLIRENYSAKVIEDYDFIIKDMKAKHPSGRISILEGSPGTGKTHLVRAMLMEVPDAMFVLVSPDMVSSLAGPELLPLLLTYRHAATGPIILILEDADKCLVTRAGDNINSIQSLLNLGDGILGSLLDLRIVATTNAKRLEMEPAILRAGRLCRRLEVGCLTPKEGAAVFSRLLPEMKEIPSKLTNAREVSLAEVYSIARNSGWSPEARETEDNIIYNYDDEDDDEDE
jgi:hypothetical protein